MTQKFGDLKPGTRFVLPNNPGDSRVFMKLGEREGYEVTAVHCAGVYAGCLCFIHPEAAVRPEPEPEPIRKSQLCHVRVGSKFDFMGDTFVRLDSTAPLPGGNIRCWCETTLDLYEYSPDMVVTPL